MKTKKAMNLFYDSFTKTNITKNGFCKITVPLEKIYLMIQKERKLKHDIFKSKKMMNQKI